MCNFILLVIFSFLIINRVSLLEDDNHIYYYWKEYTGAIPADAIVGAYDANGKEIYIGQAYTDGVGLIPVEIHAGVTKVFVPLSENVREVGDYIKILCGPKDTFYWLATNRRNLHSTLRDKDAVIGGHIHNRGRVYVGRSRYLTETKIGRVASYDHNGSAYLYFHGDSSKQKSVGSYEILMYKRDSSLNTTNKDLDAQITDIFKGL